MRVQSAIRALQRQRPEKGEPWFPKGKRVFQPSWKARPTPPTPKKIKMWFAWLPCFLKVVLFVVIFGGEYLICANGEVSIDNVAEPTKRSQVEFRKHSVCIADGKKLDLMIIHRRYLYQFYGCIFIL